MLCKYWNELQIITKIVCDGVYSMSINIYIFLCPDYSQAFFLSLTWSNVVNDLIWREKMFTLATKYHEMGTSGVEITGSRRQKPTEKIG